jgi:F-type H+-transporting ATPase subunit b
MPQFEQADTFVSQLFWLVVTFGVLYLVLRYALLPRIADVLESRQDRIANDLEEAEKLKRESEDALQAYEAALATARAHAQEMAAVAKAEATKDADRRSAELEAKLAEDIKTAEVRIQEVRSEALTGIRTVAQETAQAITAKLIGVDVDAGSAEKAISGAFGGER